MTELLNKFPPHNITQSKDTLCQNLLIHLEQELPELSQQLLPDLSYIDSEAHIVGQPKLTLVEWLEHNKFRLHYCVDWQFFHGCSDKSDQGVVHEKVRFELHENGTINMHFPQTDALTLADEL